MVRFGIRRIAYALGAEITGIDLREQLDSETVASLREAWLEDMMLSFPEQDLTGQQLCAFAQRFGELERLKRPTREAALPELGHLTNQARDGVPWNGYKNGTTWHSDENYTTQPTAGTFVLAKRLPTAGGDTMFANQCMAYDTLSPALRAILDELSLVQVIPPRATPPRPDELPTVQPAVRVHPETGRKGLFFGSRSQRFIGMTEEESKPLIDFVNAHAVRYEFTYRHRWEPNNLVLWDNRCLMHIALRDYDERREPRVMLRTACKGEPSGYAFSGDDRVLAGAAV